MNQINQSGGRAIGITSDATDPQSLKSAFETIEETLPGSKLAAAIYNVNTKFGRKPFLDSTLDDLDSNLNAST